MTQRLTRAEISFDFTDLTAAEDASYSVNTRQNWNIHAESDLMGEGTPTDYATLELNDFILDGSARSFPDIIPDDEYFGWWSGVMSGPDGSFTDVPELDITFSQPHSSVGITIGSPVAENIFPTQITVYWYDATDALIRSETFHPDEAVFFCDQPVSEYQRIRITFDELRLPSRYLRFAKVIYGVLKIFSEKELVASRIIEEIDPISTRLPINTLTFSFRDKDGRFNILDLEGAFAMLQQRQKLKATGYINDEPYDMGTFYLDYPETKDGSVVELSCIDLLGVIDQTEFRGGIYANKAVTELLAEICASASLEDGELILDPSLANETVTGWLPICTHREALQRVALAIGAIVDCSRSGAINIYPAPDTVTIDLDVDRKVADHSIKLDSLITGVEVTAHSYRYSIQTKDLETAELDVGEHEIRFSEPVHSLQIKRSESTGTATITESGVNYAIINVTVAGTIVIKGDLWLDVQYLVGHYMDPLPLYQKPNVLTLGDDMTLVNWQNASAVARRIYNYYQRRYENTGDIILDLDTDKVGAQAEVISTQGTLTGPITELDIDFTGGMLAGAKVIGAVPETEQEG